MAVKVVYDSKRGLVQENDTTGAGGFEIKDAFLDQGVQDVSAAASGDAALDLSASGVSLVTTTAGNDHVAIPDPAAAANVGQMKTVILKADGGDLVIRANGNSALATLTDPGDVAIFIWDSADWRLVMQTA